MQDRQQALNVLENHWKTWIVEDDFRQMKAAGLNHVRYVLVVPAPISHRPVHRESYAPQDSLGLLVNTPHVRGYQSFHRPITLYTRGVAILPTSPRLGQIPLPQRDRRHPRRSRFPKRLR